MDFFQLLPKFGVHVPPQRRTNDPRSKVVIAVFRVPDHDGEILGNIFQQHVQRVHAVDDGLILQDPVAKDVALLRTVGQREVLRIARTEKLESHFHHLFATEFAAGKVVEHQLAMFGEGVFALGNAGDVVFFDFEPPVRFELGEG